MASSITQYQENPYKMEHNDKDKTCRLIIESINNKVRISTQCYGAQLMSLKVELFQITKSNISYDNMEF